jgi:type IV pilus assembly protein PilQ
MKGFLRLFIVALMATTLVRCSTAPTGENGDISEFGASDQDFASFDSGAAASSDNSSNDVAASTASEDAIEKELNAAEGKPADESQAAADNGASEEPGNLDNAEIPPKAADQAQAAPESAAPEQAAPPAEQTQNDDFALFDDNNQQAEQAAPPPPEVEPAPQEEPPAVAAEPVAPAPEEAAPEPEAPAPQIAEEPAAPEEAAPVTQKVHIKDIRYQASDGGGTVVIQADGPMTYQTRVNEDTHQFVIEIPNARLPSKLKRSLNTKDMTGSIGAIDA